MNQTSSILVTGAEGMVGRALANRLESNGHSVIRHSRKDCDLEDRKTTLWYFQDLKPDYVFHIAAVVGGIKANMENPVRFLQANLLSQTHTIEAAYQAGVKKFLFLGSSCIYPRECPQPMKEEHLLSGPLEPTNEGYALAKITGIRLCQYYSKQYGFNAVAPMPCNVYGPGDSFDLEKSHVLSALVKRFIDAQRAQSPSIALWGTGSARREFIHLEDLVEGMLFVMENINDSEIYNLGTGIDFSIKELAEMIARMTGFKGRIEWDHSKPDGMMKKCLDVSKLKSLGFEGKISIEQGIQSVIEDYKRHIS